VRNHRRAEQLDQLLSEGLESGAAVTPDETYWNDKKAALHYGDGLHITSTLPSPI